MTNPFPEYLADEEVFGAGLADAYGTLAALPTPTVSGLSAEAIAATSIAVSWDAVETASGYHVELRSSDELIDAATLADDETAVTYADLNPETSYAVTVSVARSGPDWRVAVRDRGPGVPAQFRDRIFGRFAQADASDSRARGGAGLGLSIARAIVEAHDGVIGFDCPPEGGSVFAFRLPAAEPQEPARAEAEPPRRAPFVAVFCRDPERRDRAFERRAFATDAGQGRARSSASSAAW